MGMSNHPINLAVRFLLEIAMLIAAGIWGWNQYDSWLRYLLAVGAPLLLAAVWGVFNVPGDPSRSGKAPVVVPGIVRLILELSMFGFGIWATFDLGYTTFAIVFGTATILHYVISYDRILWLLRK